ncbi:MAG TPA: cellulose binding domain-containing protein [Streptosporangiaceae bacterium]|nr:cellulose binding domain-containing protein [Streptosporangiaceae bacterium]
MSRTFIAVAAALVAVLGFITMGPARHAQAAAVRIMPLGDSITGSPGCWRALLWNRLQSNGFTNIDFVGTLPPQGCGVPYDGDNEGHGGALVTNVADQNQLPGWLAATTPDIVLMHFGTNDVWSGLDPATILAAYSRLVDQMRASNPAMKILVAQIIPLNPGGCGDCPNRAIALNNAIPAWASGKTTAQSPIVVVDQWTGFNTATDTGDGVHPNDAGIQKISDRWYPALSAQLTPGGGTTTPPTTPPVTTPPGPACTAAYRVINSWPGGFQGEVAVTAGPSSITGWQARWTFTGGQVIGQLWGGSFTQSGGAVTVSNMSYNGRLAPGGAASFGFTATQSGTNPVPSVTCSGAA